MIEGRTRYIATPTVAKHQSVGLVPIWHVTATMSTVIEKCVTVDRIIDHNM